MDERLIEYELSSTTESRFPESVELSMAKAQAETELQRRELAFDGLMAISKLSNCNEKVPRPKRLSSLRKSLLNMEETERQNSANLQNEAESLGREFGVSTETASQIIGTAQVLSEDLAEKGLIYKDKPYNIALLAPYPLDKGKAERLADLSTSALQALYKLSLIDPQAMYLLNRGSTEIEKVLYPLAPGYDLAAPVNRIDCASGKIIEFGPTYADGFATAQTLNEVWGMSSKSVDTLAASFRLAYEDFCKTKNLVPKENPSLGLIYIRSTQDMADELETLGKCLAAKEEKGNSFSQVVIGQPQEVMAAKPDIVFYYLKPSMIDGYEGNPLPESKDFVEQYGQGVCIVPPFREQLGKKVGMAIIQMYPEYFAKEMGQENYNELLSMLLPTEIVGPGTSLPDFPAILKPSSGGSCDGVIDSDDPLFAEVFKKAQADFPDDTKDLWVLQPKVKETVPAAWVKDNQKNRIYKLESPTVKQTVFVAGGQLAGAYATVDTNWIIDDGGFSYPCRLKENV